MKTLYFILACLAFTLTRAQVTLDGTPIVNPPGTVIDKFNKQHTGITNPRWENDGTYYSAEYTDPKTNSGRRVVYDTQGNLICNETEIKPGYYPQCIGDHCKKNFANEEYKIWTCKDKHGKRTYYTRQKNTLVWFDKNGKYTSTTPIKHPDKELITIK